MRYIDDLTQVSVKEIIDISPGMKPIQAIVTVKTPSDKYDAVVIVYEDGQAIGHSIDGRAWEGAERAIIFKPKKVKRLKPLHAILTEHPYTFIGSLYLIGTKDEEITHFTNYDLTDLYNNCNKSSEELEGLGRYPDSFFEEVEE
jgi:hypothetical protein